MKATSRPSRIVWGGIRWVGNALELGPMRRDKPMRGTMEGRRRGGRASAAKMTRDVKGRSAVGGAAS